MNSTYYKNLMALLMLLISSTNLQADFIAYRKLTNPTIKQVVHVLYDIHATPDLDPSVEREITRMKKEDLLGRKGRKDGLEKMTKNHKLIDQQLTVLRTKLPNVVKQHNDLIAIVKRYNISLIDEDWPYTQTMNYDFPYGHTGKYLVYITRNIGKQEIYKKFPYRSYVSPMLGIGKALTGKFTTQEFVAIPGTTAYFYNPDKRQSAGFDIQDKELENATLKALQTLQTHYNQSAVIIAQGLEHSRIILDDLTKRGYTAGPLIISSALTKKRSGMPQLDQFLKNNLKENLTDLPSASVNYSDDPELIYTLIANPLDLKTIFEKVATREPILEPVLPEALRQAPFVPVMQEIPTPSAEPQVPTITPAMIATTAAVAIAYKHGMPRRDFKAGGRRPAARRGTQVRKTVVRKAAPRKGHVRKTSPKRTVTKRSAKKPAAKKTTRKKITKRRNR